MGLMAMLEEVLNGEPVTLTVATPATVKPKTPLSVASVATVTVASTPKLETDRPVLHLVYSAGERTEQEAALYTARLQSFQGKGVSDDAAAKLAARLVERDRQLDDRRVCAECVHWHAGRCLVGLYPAGWSDTYTLHRCKGFQLNEVSHDI